MAASAALVAAPSTHYAGVARAAARSILSKPPYVRSTQRPGVLAAFVTDVGRAIVDVVRWVIDLFRRAIGHPVEAGAHRAFGSHANLALLALVAVAATVVCVVLVRRAPRRSPSPATDPSEAARRRRVAELLDRAAAARRAGDLDGALRLRFEAGLERLEARGTLTGRQSLTTEELSARLASPRFDGLASVHTLVAYGGAHATARDVDAAFELWPGVLDEALAAAHR